MWSFVETFWNFFLLSILKVIFRSLIICKDIFIFICNINIQSLSSSSLCVGNREIFRSCSEIMWAWWFKTWNPDNHWEYENAWKCAKRRPLSAGWGQRGRSACGTGDACKPHHEVIFCAQLGVLHSASGNFHCSHQRKTLTTYHKPLSCILCCCNNFSD